MSIPEAIDEGAPVVVRAEVEIDAPPEKVWGLVTDVNGWTGWQSDITDARMDGPFESENFFIWTSFDFTVTSEIYSLDQGARILWGGTASGITGIHEWLFTPQGDGVKVVTNESFAGEPIEADADNMRAQLEYSLNSWLEKLKSAVEPE